MRQKDRYRWREQPNVIARYVLGRDIPKHAWTILKPNEVCCVVKDGVILQTFTKQVFKFKQSVSPGFLHRSSGADIAFMFVLLGPHELSYEINGRSHDGVDLNGRCQVHVNINPTQVQHFLRYPACGRSFITLDHLSTDLEDMVKPLAVRTGLGEHSLQQIRYEYQTHLIQQADFQLSLHSALEPFGLSLHHAHVQWDESYFERAQRSIQELKQDRELELEHTQSELESNAMTTLRYQASIQQDELHRRMKLEHEYRKKTIEEVAKSNVATDREHTRISQQRDLALDRQITINLIREKEREMEALEAEHEQKLVELQLAILEAKQDMIEIESRRATRSEQERWNQSINRFEDFTKGTNSFIDQHQTDLITEAFNIFEAVQQRKVERSA
jgi:hypothetical protein